MILRIKAVLIAFGLFALVAACEPQTNTQSDPAAAQPTISAVEQLETLTTPSPATTTPITVVPVPIVVPELLTADEALEALDENMQRLRDLDVLELGQLLVAVPESAMNCYVPKACTDPEVYAQYEGEAAIKLAKLVDVAEQAALFETSTTMCEQGAIDANLASLNSLEIVSVWGLITTEPANNPSCYSLPCQEDIDLANKMNCDRAGQLANIALAAAIAFDAPTPNIPVTTPEELLASVDANLTKLADLEVVQVGQLLLDLPDGAMNCYGPCPEFADEIAAAEIEAATRLAEFTLRAEAAVELPSSPQACEPESVEANLAALQSLKVIGVFGMVVAEPANNPMCYNLPCAEDIEAADKLNCERAGDLANIVEQTQDL